MRRRWSSTSSRANNIVDADGNNVFSRADGNASPEFFHFIAGLQKYVPLVMPLFAPYVNSYRPRHLEDAIEALRGCVPVRELLGEKFIDAFCAVKALEFGTYNRVISSWEREHLLLLV